MDSIESLREQLSKERELRREAEQVLIPTQESLILAESNLEKAETRYKELEAEVKVWQTDGKLAREHVDDLQATITRMRKALEYISGYDLYRHGFEDGGKREHHINAMAKAALAQDKEGA